MAKGFFMTKFDDEVLREAVADVFGAVQLLGVEVDYRTGAHLAGVAVHGELNSSLLNEDDFFMHMLVRRMGHVSGGEFGDVGGDGKPFVSCSLEYLA